MGSNSQEVFQNAVEFIPSTFKLTLDKLYFSSVTKQVSVDLFPDVHFFTIDHILVYINFYADFGPNNISHVFRFIELLGNKLKTYSSKKVCLVSSMDADKRANAAYLLCSYMMLVYKLTPEQVYSPLVHATPAFTPYRDAGYGPATYYISILDCLQGLYKALQLGLFHIDSFDLESYEFYEKVENGDLNWITSKFVALASPKDENSRMTSVAMSSAARFGFPFIQQQKKDKGNLYSVTNIDKLVRYLKENNVCTIIRLNNKLYDRKKFVENGIEHIEMYFPDGSTPPDDILEAFLQICESRKGAIAVHCKAGLGRTGSLIGAYLMKHYRMTAAETISFMRVVRPGSVVGPQQNWLQSMQQKVWSWTPQFPIDSCYSLLEQSSWGQYQRFNQYREACPISTTSISNDTVCEKIEYNIDSEEERLTSQEDLIVQATRTGSGKHRNSLKGHFRVVKGVNSIHKNMTDHMQVPIQPRKGQSNPSLDKDEPLAHEALDSVNRYEEYVASISQLSNQTATQEKGSNPSLKKLNLKN